MIQNEILISAQVLQWRCVESKIDNERLHYSRFAISPFRCGQANTVGIAMRRALLGEVKGTSITCAKFEKVTHEYSTIAGIQESVHDISINSKEIVLESNSSETQKAFISILGPKKITAQDIILPPSVKIIDGKQYIATLTKAIQLDIELEIEKDYGYRIQNSNKSTNSHFFIDAIFMPIRNANYSVHSFENENKTQEMLFIEIWTNGSITPKDALYEASRSLIDLFIPFLHAERREIINELENEYKLSNISYFSSFSPLADKITKEVSFKHIFIDQLELPARAYNCLKRVNVNTLADLLNYSQEDLMKIKNFGKKSVEQVLEALQKQFSINLPKNKIYFY
uniref:DNA-directed RNA polymerase subunit alpha n=1 Tax=Buxbaumia aphylla TaxID=70128 RepID=Q5EFZ1_BUXAP|nr:RNA polymerase alpha subunit [Buxbaumia aphylla]AAW81772.1 RNA polymerase alpha subunit [Buxbaumia aphylla]QHU77152.1 RNA polymerase alpha subunit [Buxbaumia aphylla]